MTVTKADIVGHLEDCCNIEHDVTINLVEVFFEEIKLSLEKGDSVKLAGFGTFQVHKKNARPGRNPKTGEAYEVSERNVVSFKVGTKLRGAIKSMPS
jgi:integration host factor subunit alpha